MTALRFCPSALVVTAILFCLVLSGLAHGQVLYQDQEVQVHDLPALVSPSHDRSEVLLTSLDTILHDKDICCGKNSALVDSAHTADPRSLKDIAAKLGGRHLLSDGRPMKVTAEYLTPDAVIAGHVVTMIVNQHAALMEWNSHLYVVYGAVFVWTEDRTSGARSMYIHKLLLWDTRFPDSRRTVVFDRETEDPTKVEGLLFLQVEGES